MISSVQTFCMHMHGSHNTQALRLRTQAQAAYASTMPTGLNHIGADEKLTIMFWNALSVNTPVIVSSRSMVTKAASLHSIVCAQWFKSCRCLIHLKTPYVYPRRRGHCRLK